jgi:hypothetical protein
MHVVLSYGRAGSVLLAQRLGRYLGTLPSYNPTPPLELTALQHSHRQYTRDQRQDYCCYFAVRKDISMNILSFLLTQHYGVFHVFQDQEPPQRQPFEFQHWSLLNQFCAGFCDWHDFYGQQLQVSDTVIFLEDMLQAIRNSNELYVEAYPNKSQFISNYQQVLDRVQAWLPKMQMSLTPFYQHHNQQDIYPWLNQDFV